MTMKNFAPSLFLLCLCAPAFAETDDARPADEVKAKELPEVKVTASHINRPFQTPAAVSHIESNELGRDLNEVLRSSPSLFTQHDIGQGGIAVNLRGLEGMGRVNTSIDGVSQTFYQTNPAHGWNGSTVYVNEDFLAGADVERGHAKGMQGGNALGGSVNFRTLSPSDLVEKGSTFGGRLTLRRGNNGYGNNGMAAVAYQSELAGGGSFGSLLAFGGKVRGGYRNGAGEVIAGSGLNDRDAPMESGVHARSFMGKLEYAPNRHHSFKFNYIGNRSRSFNNHTPINITTNSGVFQYRFQPLSDKIDLRANIAYTNAQQYFVREKQDSGYQGRHTKNPTWQLDVSNQSHFELGNSDLNINYGMKLSRIRYGVDEGALNNPEPSNVLAKGHQDLGNLFVDARYQVGKWTLSGGVRYERYAYGGYLPKTEDNGAIVFPAGGNINFVHRAQHFNPHFGLAYQATDWLQLYANYAHTARAPLVQEFMYVNNLHNNPYSVNPHLKSETSRNTDIGFNIFKQGILHHQDTARLKVNYFRNNIANYIYQHQFYVCDNYTKCSLDDYINGNMNIPAVGINMNMADKTRIQGWEIEGGYDFGRAYINLAYSRSKSKLPIDWLADTTSTIRTQPSYQLVLDVGTRWLNERLELGARLTRMGDDTVPAGVDTDLNLPTTTKIKGGQNIYDLYAKYAINKKAKLFFNIENLTNTVYNYPLSSGGTLGTGNTGDPAGWANKGTGRGRTVSAGITLQF